MGDHSAIDRRILYPIIRCDKVDSLEGKKSSYRED